MNILVCVLLVGQVAISIICCDVCIQIYKLIKKNI